MSTDQQWDIVTGVGITALGVAAARAVETSRPDPLAADPYAAGFVAAAQAPVSLPTTVDAAAGGSGSWAHLVDYMALRTRAFDDHFQRAIDDGVTQAVILASGLDTRAYRLGWQAGTTVYEIDQPRVLDFELRVLREAGAEPRCALRPTAVDLRDDWATTLESAGFETSRPTAWLAEGLLPFLPPEAEERLLREIHRLSAPGSHLAAEYFTDVRRALQDPVMQQNAAIMGVQMADLMSSGPRPDLAERLAARGWRTRIVTATEEAAAHARVLTSTAMFDNVRHVFARLPWPETTGTAGRTCGEERRYRRRRPRCCGGARPMEAPTTPGGIGWM
ncbi:SAM-dependent methyltransferase [Streptomyces noursei]|uniref:SAM-dependent methyltransferase n=1 Tax=Streptomyces noursei TaxID=1971 RepID=UPI0023B860AA|nr:SAM-dependent methyltransferase [Streptomyces noursei]